MSRLGRIRSRLAREDGIALVTATMLILVVGIFSAIMAQSAVNVNDSSSRDRDAKRSLAAGEAALNSAVARLNGARPFDHQCLADGPLETEAQVGTFFTFDGNTQVNAGQCRPSSVERGGNSERFYYHVSPVLTGGVNGCNNPIGVQAGVTRASLLAGGLVVLERCITAVGGANRVQRRFQQRAFATLQPFNAITVDERLEVNPSADAGQRPSLGVTQINANNEIEMRQTVYSGQMVRYRGAPAPQTSDVTGTWTSTTSTRPFPLSHVDPEPFDEPTENANQLAGSIGCVGPVTDPLCVTAKPFKATGPGGEKLDTLTIPAGYTVTLEGPKTYHFCDLTVSGGTLAVTGGVDVFVDHPARETGTGDSCDDGLTTGKVSISGGIVNPAGTGTPSNAAPDLRLWIRGEEDAEGFSLAGGATTLVNALVYGPVSTMKIAKASGPTALTGPTFTGAISARALSVTGNLTTVAGLANLQFTADPDKLITQFVPEDWVECRREPTPGLPHSRCRGS